MKNLREIDTSRWYAVRAKPGTQRAAKAVEGRKPDETIIERQLRNEGIDVYMPSFRLGLRHHRTNRLIVRRMPLLVGYVFVHLPRLEFELVRGVESVMCVLAPSRTAGPIRFPETTIAKLLLIEMKDDQDHRRAEWRREEIHRNHLHGQLKKVLPKGRARNVSLRDWADRVIGSMSDEAQAHVLRITRQLDEMESDEPIAEIEKVA